MSQPTLSIKDLADRWGRHPQVIWEMVNAGKLPFMFKIGRNWRARIEDVIKFEDSKKVKPPKKSAR